MTAWPDPARPGVPLNPEQEGLHWLRYEHDGYVEVSAFLWDRDGYWVKSRHVHYSEWPGRWAYLGPVLSHDEATALQARVVELECLAGLADSWITAALECKDWHWDADQHEAATHTRDEIRAALEGKKE